MTTYEDSQPNKSTLNQLVTISENQKKKVSIKPI